jgi:hypothetical protein
MPNPNIKESSSSRCQERIADSQEIVKILAAV